MEIERKFRLEKAPLAVLAVSKSELITQGYLPMTTGELRIRRKGEHSYLTIKGDGALSRAEWEVETPLWVFDQLWPATAGRRIEKARYSIPYEGLTLEMDVYHGRLEGLVTLECEFTDEPSSEKFELPEWAEPAIDVTANEAYKNKVLACNGVPKSFE